MVATVHEGTKGLKKSVPLKKILKALQQKWRCLILWLINSFPNNRIFIYLISFIRTFLLVCPHNSLSLWPLQINFINTYTHMEMSVIHVFICVYIYTHFFFPFLISCWLGDILIVVAFLSWSSRCFGLSYIAVQLHCLIISSTSEML